MDRERLKGNLDLLLLSILAAGPAHGYAIISALRERSEGTFDLPEGTIYPALHRLEEAGLLASTWAQAEGRRRHVYGLTDEGAAALAAQRTEWRRFARGVQAVLGKPALGAPAPGPAGMTREEDQQNDQGRSAPRPDRGLPLGAAPGTARPAGGGRRDPGRSRGSSPGDGGGWSRYRDDRARGAAGGDLQLRPGGRRDQRPPGPGGREREHHGHDGLEAGLAPAARRGRQRDGDRRAGRVRPAGERSRAAVPGRSWTAPPDVLPPRVQPGQRRLDADGTAGRNESGVHLGSVPSAGSTSLSRAGTRRSCWPSPARSCSRVTASSGGACRVRR